MSKILSHITDLHLLDDAEVAQFAAELPGFVASLRVAATAAQAEGMTLSQAFPNITFVPELKDATVYRAGDKSLQVSHQDALRADSASRARTTEIKAAQQELNSSLLSAAQIGNLATFRILLESGADLNTRTPVQTISGAGPVSYYGGDTVLHVAASSGSNDIVKAILDLRFDINARNAKGHTALFSATRESHRNTALLLVSRGADTFYFADPENGSEGFKNGWPLQVGSTNFKGMSMHKAAIRLGDINRVTELLAESGEEVGAELIKSLVKEAKSAKRPDIVAFLQAKGAAAQIASVRKQSGQQP